MFFLSLICFKFKWRNYISKKILIIFYDKSDIGRFNLSKRYLDKEFYCIIRNEKFVRSIFLFFFYLFFRYKNSDIRKIHRIKKFYFFHWDKQTMDRYCFKRNFLRKNWFELYLNLSKKRTRHLLRDSYLQASKMDFT